ncbi:MAG TPA: exodeoxyribonuclease VII large subunit [Candidatus Paceibacterota bacterium]|nr:exodeoxyribonuclease VII large subunit [Candidatus Paceibacterota bacterium]
MPGKEEKIFSVAELIDVLNTFFKREEVRITGEICELKRAASGHVYFTLKDKGDGSGNGAAVLDAIIWSRNYQLCGIALEVGMEVVLTGHPNIYPPSGRLSFVADTVELVGEGALKRAYEALKAKLAAEGMFDEGRKRPLPDLPRRIGVVTSLKGAVIHDFGNNLGKFGFTVNVCDSRVEGAAAAKDLLASIAAMRELAVAVAAGGGLDALVIIRGGGSLESLQAFNNEALVRAVVDFPVPVIAGIGHDQDVPLVALAADHMVSTPTAAAHLLNRSWEAAYAEVHRLASVFVRMQQELKRRANDLDAAWDSMAAQIERRLAWAAEQIDYATRYIRLNDPRRQLKLGYSITRKNGKIVRSTRAFAAGDELETELSDGSVRSRVEQP